MKPNTETLPVLVQRQLDLESSIADALEELNGQMASLLDDAGIYGPTKTDLDSLSPLVQEIQNRYEQSRQSRESLAKKTGRTERLTSADAAASSADWEDATLRSVISILPPSESDRLDEKRQSIHNRLRDAQQQLTANQVVIFYSTEFHRRYLLGVLQCDVEEANYQADGQAFKLGPEKIIGRNC